MAVPCFLCAQMPAHVVIRVTAGASPETDLYVDAFHRRVMDWGGLASFMRSTGIDQMQAEFVVERPATAIYARVLRNLVSLSANAAGAERGVRPAANGRLRTDLRDNIAGGGL